jgi:hypothetical protein
MLSQITKLGLASILLTTLAGCGLSGMGEAHLINSSDQKKAIESNPNLSAKDKARALRDVDLADANTHKK